MEYLTFSKLKAQKKAKCLCQKINLLSNSFPDVKPDDLYSRIRNNSEDALYLLKLVWQERKKRKNFIWNMEQVILNNSEQEYLFLEAKSYGFMNTEIYEEYMEDSRESRSLQLEIINNVSVYFEKGEAPEYWFEL